jgi:hypothetical protein
LRGVELPQEDFGNARHQFGSAWELDRFAVAHQAREQVPDRSRKRIDKRGKEFGCAFWRTAYDADIRQSRERFVIRFSPTVAAIVVLPAYAVGKFVEEAEISELGDPLSLATDQKHVRGLKVTVRHALFAMQEVERRGNVSQVAHQ